MLALAARANIDRDSALASGGNFVAIQQLGVAASPAFDLFDFERAVAMISKHELVRQRLVGLRAAKIKGRAADNFQLRRSLRSPSRRHSETEDEEAD